MTRQLIMKISGNSAKLIKPKKGSFWATTADTPLDNKDFKYDKKDLMASIGIGKDGLAIYLWEHSFAIGITYEELEALYLTLKRDLKDIEKQLVAREI